MTQSPFIQVDASSRYKGFDFAPWGGIEGFLEASKRGHTGNLNTLKTLVPDLARAVDMTAVAVASLPFDILDKNDEIVDSSENWQNKLGGMPNPQRLMYLIASSLCGGDAYLIPTRTTKLIFDLQYCAPASIEPYIDINGLQWFDRTTDKGKTERVYPDDMVYFWLPDSDVEIGPALNHPLGNASLDAQVVYSMKNTMRLYAERGFVPITLLGSKGMPSEAERQRAEGFFNRLLRGGFDVLAKIINSDALELIRVGAGMDDLKQSYIEMRKDAKESIADSFGIPPPLFMSDNAYASEYNELRKHWYETGRFVSFYQTIEEVMTEQLYKPYGYKMRYNLQAMAIFQEDETQRSSALGALVSSISTDPEVAQLSMSILGYDLDKAQADTLNKLVADKEANREQAPQPNGEPLPGAADIEQDINTVPSLTLNGAQVSSAVEIVLSVAEGRMPRDAGIGQLQTLMNLSKEQAELCMGAVGLTFSAAQPTNTPRGKPEEYEADIEPEEQEEAKHLQLSAEEIKDLALWYDRARQWNAKGKGTAVDWENKHLPESLAAPIRLKLASAQNEADISAAFNIRETPATADHDAIKALAATIEKAIQAVKDSE